jgi:hypothetical protein
MPTMNRRDLVRAGLVATAGAAIDSHGSRAFSYDKMAPDAVLSATDVPARLTNAK